MIKLFSTKIVFPFLGVIISMNVFAQNMENMLIEPENCEGGIVIPEQFRISGLNRICFRIQHSESSITHRQIDTLYVTRG
jgi:hypothetical protein